LPTPPFWFAIAIILPINLLEILAVKSTINYVDRKSFLSTGSKQ